jgi:hypothetical protein
MLQESSVLMGADGDGAGGYGAVDPYQMPVSQKLSARLALLSIFPAHDDYKVNDSACKVAPLTSKSRGSTRYICLGFSPGERVGAERMPTDAM